jgi:hypothetical protein
MPRLRKALRVVLASSLALALWALARPALAASAPFCDDRAASDTAPPPALEAPDVGIQRAHVTAACPADDSPLGLTLRRGRSSSVPSFAGAEALLATFSRAPLVPPQGTILDPAPLVQSPRSGVRSRIERPPRG